MPFWLKQHLTLVVCATQTLPFQASAPCLSYRFVSWLEDMMSLSGRARDTEPVPRSKRYATTERNETRREPNQESTHHRHHHKSRRKSHANEEVVILRRWPDDDKNDSRKSTAATSSADPKRPSRAESKSRGDQRPTKPPSERRKSTHKREGDGTPPQREKRSVSGEVPSSSAEKPSATRYDLYIFSIQNSTNSLPGTVHLATMM